MTFFYKYRKTVCFPQTYISCLLFRLLKALRRDIFSNVFSYISKSIFRSSKALRRGVKLKRRKAYYSRPKRDVSVCYFKDTVIVQIKDIVIVIVIVLFKDVHEPVLLAYFFFFFWIMLCRDLLFFFESHHALDELSMKPNN